MFELIFIRHGTSVGNSAFREDRDRPENKGLYKIDPNFHMPSLEKLMTERPNWSFELNEQGIREAHSVAPQLLSFFENTTSTVIFSSKFVRTRATRDIIVEDLMNVGVSFEQIRLYEHECLNERIQADENYLTKEEQKTLNHILKTRIGSYHYRSHGVGMSWQDMCTNVRTFLHSLILQFPETKRAFVVGHGVWHKAFEMVLQEIPIEEIDEFGKKEEVANCTPLYYCGPSWFELTRQER